MTFLSDFLKKNLWIEIVPFYHLTYIYAIILHWYSGHGVQEHWTKSLFICQTNIVNILTVMGFALRRSSKCKI